jgi:hypothetical protein
LFDDKRDRARITPPSNQLYNMSSSNVRTLAAILALASVVDAQNFHLRKNGPRKLHRDVTQVGKAVDNKKGLEEDVAFWTTLIRKTKEMSLPPDVVTVPTFPPVGSTTYPPTLPPVGTTPPVGSPTFPPVPAVGPTFPPVGTETYPPTLPPVPVGGGLPTFPPVPAVGPTFPPVGTETYPPTLPPVPVGGGLPTFPPVSTESYPPTLPPVPGATPTYPPTVGATAPPASTFKCPDVS